MATAEQLSKARVRALINDCFQELRSEAEGHSYVYSDPDRERHEQRRMIDEQLVDLQQQIAGGRFKPEVETIAKGVMASHGINAELSRGVWRDILEGVARALSEQARLSEFRLRDRLADYTPTDPIFAPSSQSTEAVAPENLWEEPPQTSSGPTVKDAVAAFLAAKRKSWVGKTVSSRGSQLALLIEHLGQDRPLSSVISQDMRLYRDGIQRLRSRHHVGASLTFIGRQTDCVEHRIHAKTALIHLETAKTFFRWAVSEGYIERSPAAHLSVEKPKVQKAAKARRPFTSDELKRLFSCSFFTGCKSKGRRYLAGDVIVKDAQYWLPLLGIYTGARMGELVQLHLADVQEDAPIPVIAVTDLGSGAIGSGTEKHVKSKAGVRTIPLHPDLIALGFGDFVRQRRKGKQAAKRLFFEIPFGRDGQASTAYSKRFARLLDAVGLSDRALVFHSFRHTVEDALRNAKEPQYVIDRLIGHSDGSVSSSYGEGVSLEIAAQSIRGMKLPISPREVLAGA
ncbi:site-specific integrase [Caulobacter sp. NIBR2454]|uniref:site-specific integrase n=1 Tax=Caulobacter sp. NIBR2454 TaxID=3015996 RepID=UPI0022B69F25|nr:tyrosine-type recombinase/integrase [Caulobacter sp. NIBR2454]